jgi:hypothetical protein
MCVQPQRNLACRDNNPESGQTHDKRSWSNDRWIGGSVDRWIEVSNHCVAGYLPLEREAARDNRIHSDVEVSSERLSTSVQPDHTLASRLDDRIQFSPC